MKEKKQTMKDEVKKYMAEIGRKGGKAASSEDKAKAGKTSWAKLSPEERSKVNRERALKRWANKKNDKKEGDQ